MYTEKNAQIVNLYLSEFLLTWDIMQLVPKSREHYLHPEALVWTLPVTKPSNYYADF